MDLKVIENNKKFWKSIKPLFSGKSKLKTNITLAENGQMVTEKREVAETLNNYFIEAVQNLEIENFNSEGVQEIQTENTDEVIEIILEKYKTDHSILKIKENVKVEKKFKFDNTTEDDVYSKIKSLDPKKTGTENDIPAKALIGTNDIVCGYLSNMYNDSKKIWKLSYFLKEC